MTESLDESEGGFEMFRARARDPRSSDEYWRTGFDPLWRKGSEAMLAHHIVERFLSLHDRFPAPTSFVLVDIGSGASKLTEELASTCYRHDIEYVCVDSTEMLSHIGSDVTATRIPGRFPSPVLVQTLEGLAPDFILVYSVLQYALRENCLDSFLAGVLHLLPPGGVALLGDIPNNDRRSRALRASGYPTDGPLFVEPKGAHFSDAIVLDLLEDIRSKEVEAFVCPQPRVSATWRHRENIWLVKPSRSEYWRHK